MSHQPASRIQIGRLHRMEDGFSLVESVMSMVIIAVVLVMAASVLGSSLSTLRRTRVLSMATNLAQAKVEETRLLKYDEVGYSSGTPSGVLPNSESITLSGIDFDVSYNITYEGSISGLDVISDPSTPGPDGDGSPYAFNSGVDYKRLEVVVTDTGGMMGKPVVLETIVAPPSVGAHEGKSNVLVHLVKQDVDPADTSPLPVVCIYSGAVQSFQSADATTLDAMFPQQLPNSPDPMASDYHYIARLGIECNEFDASSGWIVHPDALASLTERTHVGPTATRTITLPITRPEEITVNVLDNLGNPVTGSVTLADGSRTITVDGTGTWVFNEFSPGDILTAGLYSVTATAPGFSSETVADIVVPVTGPVDIVLNPIPTHSLTQRLVNALGHPVAGVEVTFKHGSTNLLATTDSNGYLTVDLPLGIPILEKIPDFGPYARQNITEPSELLPTEVVLVAPPSTALWSISGLNGHGAMTFTIQWGWYNRVDVTPDTSGNFTYSGAGGAYYLVARCGGSYRTQWTVNLTVGSTSTTDVSGAGSC